MSQTLAIRRGTINIAKKHSLGLLDSAILNILIDRLLKGIGDPIDISALCEATAQPRTDVCLAIEHMAAVGVLRGEFKSLDDANSISIDGIAILVKLNHGIFASDGEAPKASGPAKAVQRDADGTGTDDVYAAFNWYRGSVSEDPAAQPTEKYLLTVGRVVSAEKSDPLFEQRYSTPREAWAGFDDYLAPLADEEKTAPEVLNIGGVDHRCRYEPQSADGEARVFFEVLNDKGNSVFNGTGNDMPDAARLIAGWHKRASSDANGKTKPKAAGKKGNAAGSETPKKPARKKAKDVADTA